MKNAEKLITENDSLMQSRLGGGDHWYLELILAPSKHHVIFRHHFNPHENPGALSRFSDNAMQYEIAKVKAAHKR